MSHYPQPLRQSGALRQFDHFELTPVVGTEFQNVDLAEWLTSPRSDELLRDLAIMSICFIEPLFRFKLAYNCTSC
jgi:hypothetical protein